MSGTILPCVEVPFSAATIAHTYERRFKVPFVKVRARAAFGNGTFAIACRPGLGGLNSSVLACTKTLFARFSRLTMPMPSVTRSLGLKDIRAIAL